MDGMDGMMWGGLLLWLFVVALLVWAAHRRKFESPAYSLISKVMTVTAVIALAPFCAIACVPLVCFLAPVALMALPFMVVAFFGQTKEIAPVQSVRMLQPAHFPA